MNRKAWISSAIHAETLGSSGQVDRSPQRQGTRFAFLGPFVPNTLRLDFAQIRQGMQRSVS